MVQRKALAKVETDEEDLFNSDEEFLRDGPSDAESESDASSRRVSLLYP